jgi:hypothetical protein
MPRKRKGPAHSKDEPPGGMPAAATNGAKEGQQPVVDKEEDKGKKRRLTPEELAELGQRPLTPKGRAAIEEALRRGALTEGLRVRLTTGGRLWPLQDAETAFLRLQELRSRPEEFATLLALVRPAAASGLPNTVPIEALARLREENLRDEGVEERRFLLPDGSVKPIYAAVFEAAWVDNGETKEGVVLRNPIIYPSREVYEDRVSGLEDGEFGARVEDGPPPGPKKRPGGGLGRR